ncbi:MAG: hypothetical protein H0X17_02755 [Deltaproteobacteria bacterium]|nr:hypothetical protein [Deltaproteobacteria bacterium]
MMKVLVVEESRERRDELVDALCERDQLDVRGAGVRAALATIAEEPVDAVVAGRGLRGAAVKSLIAAAPTMLVIVMVEAAEDHAWLDAGASHVVTADEELAATLQAIAYERTAEQLRGRDVSGADGPRERATTSDLLLTGIERGARVREHFRLGRARAALHAGSQIAARLIAHARDDDPDLETVDLATQLTAMVPYLQHLLPEGVEVSVISEGDTPRVRCIAAEVERLVLNIVLDASERMPWGGTVWLIVERDGAEHVRLDVLDTGNGVPPTAPVSRNQRRLALDLSRPQIERHGGRLRSVRQTGGASSVQLVLPAAA